MTIEEKTTAKLLINPLSAVSVADERFDTSEVVSSKEDWVLLNSDLIKSIGVRSWLGSLLDVLSLPAEKYGGHEIINPALAVLLSDKLRANFAQSVQREEWINANSKLIGEIGVAEWLWLLLDVLERNETN